MKNTLSHLIGLLAFVAAFLFAVNFYNFLYVELIHIPEVKVVEEDKIEVISCAIDFRKSRYR